MTQKVFQIIAKMYVLQVNNNCSTGSTALHVGKNLIEGGNNYSNANVVIIFIPIFFNFLCHKKRTKKWLWMCLKIIAGLADCVMALGFEKMEKGSLGTKVRFCAIEGLGNSCFITFCCISFSINNQTHMWQRHWLLCVMKVISHLHSVCDRT